jgi:Concanavalin A-like lectin/glucanases superfamily
VAAYGFDERRSKRAGDSSGNRNDGAIAGAKRTKGRHGGALKFDGRDDLVTVPDAATLALTDAITLEAWLRPLSRDRRWRTVLVKSRGGEIAYALYASDPHRRPTAVAGAARASATRQGAELRPGRWNHLAVTYDGEALRIYVNGELAAVRDRTGLLPLAAGPLLIGGDRRRGHAFRGAIDDVRVYGRALDADEIRADMTSGA